MDAFLNMNSALLDQSQMSDSVGVHMTLSIICSSTFSRLQVLEKGLVKTAKSSSFKLRQNSMVGMQSLFSFKTSYEVTELKPLKANLYRLNVYTIFWGLLQEEGIYMYGPVRRLTKEKFFFQHPLADNTAVINKSNIAVFLQYLLLNFSHMLYSEES